MRGVVLAKTKRVVDEKQHGDNNMGRGGELEVMKEATIMLTIVTRSRVNTMIKTEKVTSLTMRIETKLIDSVSERLTKNERIFTSK